MKRLVLIALLAAVTVGFTQTREQPYRVVFDLTSRDTLDQKAVLRWLREVSRTDSTAKMEVVLYGKGFELVMPERSTFAAEAKAALENPNIEIKVCAVALKNNGIALTQLVPGVGIVPDGIREIVSKQQDHWGYIKVGH